MFFQNRINKKMAAFQASILEKYYTEVENMYRQVRGWRHDYRNHIQALKAYMSFSEHEKVSEYLDMLDDDLTSVDTIIKTGNIMIDAILNIKISLARAKKIKVNVKAAVPGNLSVSDIDLCILIGNLLDNAIEACEDISAAEDIEGGEKFIRIFIGMKNTHLYMVFTNTAPGKKLSKQTGFFFQPKAKITDSDLCA